MSQLLSIEGKSVTTAEIRDVGCNQTQISVYAKSDKFVLCRSPVIGGQMSSVKKVSGQCTNKVFCLR